VSWHGAFFELFYCNRNHTAIYGCTLRQGCNHLHFLVLQLYFLQSQHYQWLQPHVKDVAITCIVTRLQPHQANTNLFAIWQCHGIELFFELVFLQPHFFYLCFCNYFFIFFAIAVTCCFRNCFLFLQSHCAKGCNHSTTRLQSLTCLVLATVFCNCRTSVVAATL
jgi:hypothetical protein